jgi:hypothetical protein
MELICSEKARIELIREFENNHIKYDFGRSLCHIFVEASPKARMAIRMGKERCGMQSIQIHLL